MEKILRITMGADGGPKFAATPVGEYAGLGGRALTSAIVSTEVPPLGQDLARQPLEVRDVARGHEVVGVQAIQRQGQPAAPGLDA